MSCCIPGDLRDEAQRFEARYNDVTKQVVVPCGVASFSLAFAGLAEFTNGQQFVPLDEWLSERADNSSVGVLRSAGCIHV
jgi:hypothetical protein